MDTHLPPQEGTQDTPMMHNLDRSFMVNDAKFPQLDALVANVFDGVPLEILDELVVPIYINSPFIGDEKDSVESLALRFTELKSAFAAPIILTGIEVAHDNKLKIPVFAGCNWSEFDEICSQAKIPGKIKTTLVMLMGIYYYQAILDTIKGKTGKDALIFPFNYIPKRAGNSAIDLELAEGYLTHANSLSPLIVIVGNIMDSIIIQTVFATVLNVTRLKGRLTQVRTVKAAFEEFEKRIDIARLKDEG